MASVFGSYFGGGPRQPRTQQVVQQTKLPEEIAPYAKEVLEDAKKQYLESIDRGYDPYTGQTIAPQTQEQLQAQEGLKALVGTQRPLQDIALGQYVSGITEKFTPEAAQEYMSPYQRAVTDIEKREAQRSFESQVMPQFEKQAVQAGGMSGLGTRAGVQAAELGRAQMQRLGDIEAKGLQAAYKDAQNLFTQQQQRERTAAGDIAGLAPQMVAGGVTEQGLLQSIGEEKQQLGQQALNEAYYRYLEEQAFPQEQLAGYSGFVYGNPLMSQRTMTTTSPAAMGPSKGSQLMGLGMTAAKMYGMGGGFGSGGFSGQGMMQNMFGPGRKTGGRLSGKTGGGLSSLPVVYRQNQGPVMDDDPDAYNKAQKAAEAAKAAAPPLATPKSQTDDLIAERIRIAEGRQAFSPKEIERREREDAANLQKLFTRRAGERKTASQAYQDRMEEARKRTFEAQRGLVPTGHAGYERAMRSLLRGTAAGAPQRGWLESALGAGTEMIGGIREGETAKQKALAEIEQRRGTAEMGDIKDYQTMEAADEAAAFQSELAMIKDVNPKLWKSIQDRRDKLVAAGLSEAQIAASIRSDLASEKLDIAKADAESRTGVTIKAADYNAVRNVFQDMAMTAKFDGTYNKDTGRFKIHSINGKAITADQKSKVTHILANALKKVKEGGGVSGAAKYIAVEFDRLTYPTLTTQAEVDKLQIPAGQDAAVFLTTKGEKRYKRRPRE